MPRPAGNGRTTAEDAAAAKGRGGRPPRLSRESIIAAAIDIIADEGFGRLSMRYLADRLGTSPMGIYYYFDSKTDLLGFMLAHGANRTAAEEPARDPRDRIVQLSLALAEHLSAHSWAVSALLSGEIGDDFTERSLDDQLIAARELGLDEDDARATVQGLWRIVVGQVVVRPMRPQGVRETVSSYLEGRLRRTVAVATAP